MIKKTDDKNYTAIANAIREQNGEATTYKPAQMAAAIRRISPLSIRYNSVIIPIKLSIKNVDE